MGGRPDSLPASLEQQWSLMRAAEWRRGCTLTPGAGEPRTSRDYCQSPRPVCLTSSPDPRGGVKVAGRPPSSSSPSSCSSPSSPLLLLPPALFQSHKALLLPLPTPRRYLDYITRHQARQGFGIVGFSLMPDVWLTI